MRALSLAIVIAVTAFAACRKQAEQAQGGGGGPTPPPADFRNPASPGFAAQAPDSFRARFVTSKGEFVIEVHRAWAPRGADRFYNLVRSGFFDGTKFFRVLPGFMAQFGIHGDPKVSAAWRDQVIQDDPVRRTNLRGMLSFATAGPGTRTTQVFINYGNNDRLDAMGFSPFGQVVEGMEVVDHLYSGYGEGAPGGRGPIQAQMQAQGNRYLDAGFPRLDRITKATIEAS
jgi:peptidyl-prolyl cis-trans isomerase A (cyclophilin A)